jgi:hypothetical protein
LEAGSGKVGHLRSGEAGIAHGVERCAAYLAGGEAKVAGRVGISLPSLIGARQGCPGSPTLFGCTVDGLPAYLDTHAPDAGILIQVGDSDELLVSHLMYADDIVLLGDTPSDMQQLLDALSGFRAALGLDVSLAKTQIMCFGLPPEAPRPAFTYAGPALVPRIKRELSAALRQSGFARVADAVGTAA